MQTLERAWEPCTVNVLAGHTSKGGTSSDLVQRRTRTRAVHAYSCGYDGTAEKRARSERVPNNKTQHAQQRGKSRTRTRRGRSKKKKQVSQIVERGKSNKSTTLRKTTSLESSSINLASGRSLFTKWEKNELHRPKETPYRRKEVT